MTALNQRLHYMDNLRALVMLVGVFYHASHAYNAQTNPLWFTADTVHSPLFMVVFEFIHMWRMPIFFVIAGFFTALLIQRRDMKGMLKNRLLRVGAPLVVFWPLVIAALYVSFIWAFENVEKKSVMLEFLSDKQKMPNGPLHFLGWAHLWFLFYLMIFYALTLVIKQLPLSKIKTAILNMHPTLAITILPLLLLPGLSSTIIHLRPTNPFMPQIWGILFFGMFFAYGYILFSSSRLVDYFQRTWPFLLIASFIIFIPFGFLHPHVSSNPIAPIVQPQWNVRLPLMLCIAYVSTFMSIVGLVVAKKVLNKKSNLMRYMSDASYWIYIIHLPVLFLIQFWLLDQNGGVVYKFLFSSFVTLAICLAGYSLFVRWSPVGWLLNGKRQPMFST